MKTLLFLEALILAVSAATWADTGQKISFTNEDSGCPADQNGVAVVVTQTSDPRMHVEICEVTKLSHLPWMEAHPNSAVSPKRIQFFCNSSHRIGARLIGTIVFTPSIFEDFTACYPWFHPNSEQ